MKYNGIYHNIMEYSQTLPTQNRYYNIQTYIKKKKVILTMCARLAPTPTKINLRPGLPWWSKIVIVKSRIFRWKKYTLLSVWRPKSQNVIPTINNWWARSSHGPTSESKIFKFLIKLQKTRTIRPRKKKSHQKWEHRKKGAKVNKSA